MSRRILVVDDEESICYVVQACLEQISGWWVITAKSGDEGLQIAQSESLDLILLDVAMPQMDGIQVFKMLQSNPESQNVPVIFLTGTVLLSDRQSLEALNPAGIIYKPFSAVALGQEIAAILGWSDES